MTEKKPRKPNWTSEEMEVLAEAYLSSYKVIRGKLTPVVTSEVKKRAWENITDKLVIDMFIYTLKKKYYIFLNLLFAVSECVIFFC